jgi:menaquinone-dependent protoporphyrinogen IX oxidase
MKHTQIVRSINVRLICFFLIGVGFFAYSMPNMSGAIVENSCGEGNTGGKSVLVAYDSKHGSTAIVVGQIADVLCNCGYRVDISRARTVDDLSPYDAVVVGSPIYWAKFLPGTQQFLKKYEQTLAGMPVALFVLSTNADEETGLVKEETKGFFVDKELEKVPSIVLRGDVGLFGGTFTMRELFPVEAFSMKLSGYSDMNYLDETVVTTWSETLCDLFQ